LPPSSRVALPQVGENCHICKNFHNYLVKNPPLLEYLPIFGADFNRQWTRIEISHLRGFKSRFAMPGVFPSQNDDDFIGVVFQ
jgi:hypothetical protein